MRYDFGENQLDVDSFRLTASGEDQYIEPQVFDVLRYLIEHRDRMVTKSELLDEVWGDRFVSESALTSRIKSARRAVGDHGTAQRVIRTVRGRGFEFIADVASRHSGDLPGYERLVERLRTDLDPQTPTPARGRGRTSLDPRGYRRCARRHRPDVARRHRVGDGSVVTAGPQPSGRDDRRRPVRSRPRRRRHRSGTSSSVVAGTGGRARTCQVLARFHRREGARGSVPRVRRRPSGDRPESQWPRRPSRSNRGRSRSADRRSSWVPAESRRSVRRRGRARSRRRRCDREVAAA